MNRCHIVAVSPRTGTTLLAESMRASFAIDGYEPHESRITRNRRNLSVYLTKYPADLRAVRPRLLLDRHFHALCLLRDPRDVIVSRHENDPTSYWVSLRVWKERWPVLQSLMKHPRFLIVRYEDLVRNPDGTQDWLEQRLPFLEKRHAFSAFHAVADPSRESRLALGGVREIDTSSVGNWRDHLPRIAGQLARHGPITSELIQLGYESDASWLSDLDGVEPDLTPSRVGEAPRGRWRSPSQSQVVMPWLSACSVVIARAVGVKAV